VPLSIRRVITSIDELADPSVNGHMAPMVLSPGAIRAELVSAVWPGVAVELLDYSFPLATRGESAAHRIAVIAPIRRAGVAQLNGQSVVPGSVMHVLGGATEIAGSSAGASLFATLSFDPATLEGAADALGVDIDLPGRGEFRSVRAVGWHRLRSLVLDLRQSVRESDNVAPTGREAAAIKEALLEIGVHVLAVDERQGALASQPRFNSLHIARVCEDYASASYFQNVTLAHLCGASNVSERRVRDAFYDCYGMSPTAYLRVAALHGVRDALLTGPLAPDTVSRVASDFGFWHLSRFAGQYRALFGEAPSKTLAHRANLAAS
jgi:AraC family ethanolamine operon transcriptional activator